jgi:alpha-L-rhamnosidase
LSADSRYKLWVNGEFVGRGPARSYPHAQSFDRLDLAEFWQDGENVLAVQVYQPGYSHFSYVHRGAAGMLASLRVNEPISIVSGSTWRVRRNRSFASQVERVSIYGSGIEQRNLELDDAWQLSDYAAEGWESARVVASADKPIWSGLNERVTPMLVERESTRMRLIESRLAPDYMLDDDPHWALTMAWEEGNRTQFPIDNKGWIRPKFDFGETACWLFDLGRAYTFQGGMQIRGATGHELISISYADKMKDGELVLSDASTYCRVQMTDSFAPRKGSQVIEPFNMRGGRFVLFQVSGDVSKNFAFRPHVRIAEYPLTVTKPLETEDDLLKQIVTLCENTVRACLQDSFVDCVWRESSQWLGDGLIQGMTLAAMCDDFRPMQKLLLDTAQGQDGEMMVPSIAPGEVHSYTIPRYACMWVELLAFYHDYTGDTAFVRDENDHKNRVWDCFLGLMRYFENPRNLNADGFQTTPTGRRHYIDWSPTSQNDPHCVYNLHVVLALQKGTQLTLQTKSSLPNVWGNSAKLLRSRCREAFFKDGVWYDDLDRTTHSQLAAAMALLTGAVEPHEQETQLDRIIARSLDLSDDYVQGEMVLASPFMHHYVFEALAKFGRYQAIVDIIKARWGRWAEAGYPTTWENWNVDFPDGSQCHAFSAHPRYHLMQALNAL